MTKSADTRTAAILLYQSGLTNDEVGKLVGVTGRTVKRWRAEAGIPANPKISKAKHGTRTKYNYGCRCSECQAVNRREHANGSAIRAARVAEGFTDFTHGVGGYSNWSCRCDVCCTAHHEKMRAQQASRLARGLAADDHRHGTQTAYTAWGCRCALCREASRLAKRKYLDTP